MATDSLVEPQGLTRGGGVRLDAIDMLRGLVIAIMVLDHVRDYFHIDAFAFDPTDPARTTVALFLTRWVTHLCAPTFVFLAGVSIDFQRAGGKGDAALTRFLLTRGLWLILLEATVIGFGFDFGPILFCQVIWAIGAGMIVMAALFRLPRGAVAVLGIAFIGLTQAVAGATAGATGTAAALRTFAVAPGLFPGGLHGIVMYPFVAWAGVMCLGFAAGPLFRIEAGRQSRTFVLLGLALLAGFAIVRGLNGYGDPAPWRRFPTATQTVMSVLNVSKYPPAPTYVMATLGLSALLFAGLGRVGGLPRRVLLAWGRTPLFTYVLHIYLAHGAALLVGLAAGYPAAIFLGFILGEGGATAHWGVSLPVVYLVWLAVLVILYPAARWFAGVKRRRRDWWLGYL
jgi:uncharacterized membrane protein